MKRIQLSVTVEQANLILEGLGELAFVRVYELIGQLQEQARRQVQPDAAPAAQSSPALVTGGSHGE